MEAKLELSYLKLLAPTSLTHENKLTTGDIRVTSSLFMYSIKRKEIYIRAKQNEE